jgi:hypothetical protein
MGVIRGAIGAVWSLILREPVYTQGFVVALIATGTAFGLKWDGAQVGAVSALSAAFLALLTRQAVTPVAQPTLPRWTQVTVTTPEGEPDQITTL